MFMTLRADLHVCRTPLHCALYYGQLRAAVLLLQAGAQTSLRDFKVRPRYLFFLGVYGVHGVMCPVWSMAGARSVGHGVGSRIRSIKPRQWDHTLQLGKRNELSTGHWCG